MELGPQKAKQKASPVEASDVARALELLGSWLSLFAQSKPSRKGEAASKYTETARPSSIQRSSKLLTGAEPRARRGRLEAIGCFILAAIILTGYRPPASPSGTRGRPAGMSRTELEVEVTAADSGEPGRGRAATGPEHIPLKGWKDIFWRAWRSFGRDNITQVAGGVAFFCLLAVFPAIGVFVSLYGLFSDVAQAQAQLDLLAGVLPEAALKLVGDQMLRLAAAEHAGLGVAFAVSLAASLWSANAGAKALIVGLNVAFGEKEKRGFVKLNLVSLAFTLGMILFLLLTLGAVVVTPIVLAYVGYKGALLAVLRWPILLTVAVAGLSALYRFGPSRNPERWRWVTWGSAFAALLWLTASLLFSFYVANFGSYDKTYGSLGAVVGFMTWIWVSTTTVLFGAELNSEIEHQTAVDTTVGPPEVMGQRGANMADTLGEARVS